MSFTAMRIIEHVITTADAAHPADRMLREELRVPKSLSARETTEISRAVFAYYRWFGWLESGDSLRTCLEKTQALDNRFRERPDSFSAEELVSRSVPEWIGTELRVTADWARALQSEAPVWLRARSGRAEEVAMALGDCRPLGKGLLASTLEYSGATDLFRTPAFHAGVFEIQDISSQLVGLICAPAGGETWWDTCAGEGGKLLHLSDLMQNKGLIWASDRAAWRLQKLKRRTARAGVFNYRAVAWDGGAKRPTKTKFDGVLVDAPCSGVGTWQRNPHARWTLRKDDVLELAALQAKILAHAAPAVKPGGKLIYAVCTLTRSETTEVANRFGEAHPQFKPLPIRNPKTGKEHSEGRCVLDPSVDRGNGMFIAAWKLDSPPAAV
jgi:16S rRNA (cytosine967-C5)-methyltransferase